MYESHASYGRCGLGSRGTDRLVALVKSAGPAAGLYGARITGGGSGGTVAISAGPTPHRRLRASSSSTSARRSSAVCLRRLVAGRRGGGGAGRHRVKRNLRPTFPHPCIEWRHEQMRCVVDRRVDAVCRVRERRVRVSAPPLVRRPRRPSSWPSSRTTRRTSGPSRAAASRRPTPSCPMSKPSSASLRTALPPSSSGLSTIC